MSFGSFENVGSFIRDCNGTKLRFDQACLQIITTKEVSFWSQYEECEGCVLLETAKIPETRAIVLGTGSPLRYAVRSGNGEICTATYQFGEYGQYSLNLTEDISQPCTPRMTAEPDAAFLPILTAVVILLSMATLWYVIKGIGKRVVAGRFYARYFAREDNELGSETRVLTAEASVPRSPTRSRLRSLDIFRGFSIALMIFVNAGGGGYGIFSHSVWNGLTVADVVFPWFAFAMGEALVLSLNARLRTSLPRINALQQVATRSLMLSMIGIVLGSSNASWLDVRLPGVLQRLAAMYLIVGALECAFMRTSQDITPGRSLFRDISAGWQQWLATLLLVAIQVCITLLVPAPGCPRGYMGPGGLHLSAYNQSLQNCTAGIAGYIDRLVLGPAHLYQRGTFHALYHTTVPHDPEGILGVLSGVLVVQAGAHATRIMLAYNHASDLVLGPAHLYQRGTFHALYHTTVPHDPEGILGVLSGVLVVQAGAHATRIMLAYNHARARIMRWVFWSIIFGVSGGALCMFSKNGGPIPVNKNLWSVSYCLVTSSLALAIQAALYFIVDLKTKWGGRPLYYAGQNALFLYIGSELLKRNFPLHWALSAPTHAQLLATHAAAMLIWLAVGVALHRKRIFITL